MHTVNTVEDVRALVLDWHDHGERVAFVPTMGNLHAGHLQLMEHARQLADRVVVSIFVNPLQFGENEDFDAYPRTLEQDSEKLSSGDVDVLFAPTHKDVYPDAQSQDERIEVPAALAGILCGAQRPDHFSGVATVVKRLFEIVSADVAVFGEKDYQQLLVIRWLVAEYDLPVEIVSVPTVREADGLAMSSRNQYLTDDERSRAAVLYRTLCEAGEQIRQGGRDFSAIEAEGLRLLGEAGFRPDYFSIRRQRDLATPEEGDKALIILAAVRLATARLIDNIMI